MQQGLDPRDLGGDNRGSALVLTWELFTGVWRGCPGLSLYTRILPPLRGCGWHAPCRRH